MSLFINALYCYIEKRGSQKPVAIVKILGLKIPIERERAKKKKKEKIKKQQKYIHMLLKLR